MSIVAAYQAPLLPGGSMEAIDLIADQVKACESMGVEVLCCPEGILGGLADYAPLPHDIALDAGTGELERTLAPLVTTAQPFRVELLVASSVPFPTKLGLDTPLCRDQALRDFDP